MGLQCISAILHVDNDVLERLEYSFISHLFLPSLSSWIDQQFYLTKESTMRPSVSLKQSIWRATALFGRGIFKTDMHYRPSLKQYCFKDANIKLFKNLG